MSCEVMSWVVYSYTIVYYCNDLINNTHLINSIMKAIVVDDEPFARQSIIAIISSKFPEVEIVGEAESVKESVELISRLKPDLVFLDVDLTDGSGFDVLNLLKPVTFKVIFITAHQEYAIKAIKFSALDFILKPVSSFELGAAVERVNEEIEKDHDALKYDAIDNNINEASKPKKIVLKTSDSIHLVSIDTIIRCEADNNYTTFFTTEANKIIVSKGLKEYDELLSSFGFFRVHQSHLINVSFISRFDKKDGGFVILSDDTRIPVSQRKKQKLMDIFESFNK